MSVLWRQRKAESSFRGVLVRHGGFNYGSAIIIAFRDKSLDIANMAIQRKIAYAHVS